MAETPAPPPLSKKTEDPQVVAWLAAARGGDRAAFNALVRRYQQEVYGIALQFFRDREEALDAAQDVFVQVYRKLEQFRGDALFSTWLYRVTVNTCRNRYASAQSRRKHEATVTNAAGEDETEDLLTRLPSPDASPEQQALDNDLGRELQQALAQLPEQQRLMIVLCDYRGFAYEEIAATVGCSVSAVKTGIHRGRLKLRAILQPLLDSGRL